MNLFCLRAEMIRDFMQNVFWSDRDFLIIDTPPGTSDEHISVIQNLRSYNPDGAILVTTPQVGYRKLDCYAHDTRSRNRRQKTGVGFSRQLQNFWRQKPTRTNKK